MRRELDLDMYHRIARELGRPPVVLDLGCGPNKFKYALGEDCFLRPGVDVVANLDRVFYPYKDDVVDLALLNHVIEHLAYVPRTMEELYRILAPGGRVVIRTPYYANEASFRDPTHRHHLSLKSMDYFVSGLNDEKYTAFFEKEEERLFFQKGWYFWPGKLVLRFSKNKYEKYFSHLFPGYLLYWVLKAVK